MACVRSLFVAVIRDWHIRDWRIRDQSSLLHSFVDFRWLSASLAPLSSLLILARLMDDGAVTILL